MFSVPVLLGEVSCSTWRFTYIATGNFAKLRKQKLLALVLYSCSVPVQHYATLILPIWASANCKCEHLFALHQISVPVQFLFNISFNISFRDIVGVRWEYCQSSTIIQLSLIIVALCAKVETFATRAPHLLLTQATGFRSVRLFRFTMEGGRRCNGGWSRFYFIHTPLYS